MISFSGLIFNALLFLLYYSTFILYFFLEISRLELRELNVAENQLTELPFEFYMPSLVSFCVDANPFISPPVKVCSKVKISTERFFKDYFILC